jgi:hypothetical protein
MGHKIFILGAHRSGTSKLASYFKDILAFKGDNENHIYRLLYYFKQGINDIEKSIPENAYTINRIGSQKILKAMTEELDNLISDHFKKQNFFDKTPGFQMIEIAPTIYKYVPDAKFIYLQRNGIDNVKSNHRLWPTRFFKHACEMWSNCVNAHHSIKNELGESLIDIEMNELKDKPFIVHKRILNHCVIINDTDKVTINEYFAKGSNTSTQELVKYIPPMLADQNWTDTEKQTFVELCGSEMKMLGYKYD